jgi:predicted nucleotidyltransferase
VKLLKEAQIKQILASDKNIEIAFLFGSAAAGKLRDNSDADIALLLRHVPGAQKRLDFRLDVAGKISELTERETDIVVLNTAGSLLKYQTARNGKLIFERHKGLAKKFRLAAINEYFDYLPTLIFHYERLKGKED